LPGAVADARPRLVCARIVPASNLRHNPEPLRIETATMDKSASRRQFLQNVTALQDPFQTFSDLADSLAKRFAICRVKVDR
jgi:hypothetical protein